MTEEDIAGLVPAFYAKVRRDEVLGTLFNSAVSDWPEHLEKLEAFWSSVMLTTGRYKGTPMTAHMRHSGAIQPAMFDRWIELWAETACEMLDEADAAAIVAKARRIAESLKLALFIRVDPGCARVAA